MRQSSARLFLSAFAYLRQFGQSSNAGQGNEAAPVAVQLCWWCIQFWSWAWCRRNQQKSVVAHQLVHMVCDFCPLFLHLCNLQAKWRIAEVAKLSKGVLDWKVAVIYRAALREALASFVVGLPYDVRKLLAITFQAISHWEFSSFTIFSSAASQMNSKLAQAAVLPYLLLFWEALS